MVVIADDALHTDNQEDKSRKGGQLDNHVNLRKLSLLPGIALGHGD